MIGRNKGDYYSEFEAVMNEDERICCLDMEIQRDCRDKNDQRDRGQVEVQ